VSAEKLDVAKRLAAQPEGFANGDFARAAGVNASAAGAYLSAYTQRGQIFKAVLAGKHARFFDSAERVAAYVKSHAPAVLPVSHDCVDVARACVKSLRAGMLSSTAMAASCGVTPVLVDTSLAPLVDAGKLMRIPVLRDQVAQFDYRFSSRGLPTEEDFELCRGATVAPVATISPVAPAAPAPLRHERKPPPLNELTREAGRAGAASRVASRGLERSLASPASLGWAVAPASASEEPAAAAADCPAQAVEGASQAAPTPEAESISLPPAEPPVPAPTTSEPEPLASPRIVGGVLHVDDFVCAVNSHGELALDFGGAGQALFPPAQALYLKRFMQNTTVIESLLERGLV
ncbi:MAG: hypothetical protein AB7E83_26655, partial [Ramlibacter sp.]